MSKWIVVFFVLTSVFQSLILFGPEQAQASAPAAGRSARPDRVRHMVFFRYRQSVTPAQRQQVKERFLALQTQCVRNGVPYILSIETGSQISMENAGQGMEQGFIVTFKSVADRDYYVGQPFANAHYPEFYEPAHDRFKKWLGASGYLDDTKPNPVFVFDFSCAESVRRERLGGR